MTRGASTQLVALLLGIACQTSCATPTRTGLPEPALRYLKDATYRRQQLEASVVNPSNAYSRLRLAHYSSGAAADWDRLPEWNPPVEPITASELDAPGGAGRKAAGAAAAPLPLPKDIAALDPAALLELGRLAFERYPGQPAPYLEVALASRRAAAEHGLWLDGKRGVGGLVRERMADGSTALALTCAACHAAPAGAGIEDGLPNARLDLGRAIAEQRGSTLTDSERALLVGWGPGRVDVTTELGSEPARIPDLRPVRWLTHLHQDATLAVREATLAIRIETLIITSSGQVIRPPRVVALALAAYVDSLAAALPSAPDPRTRGAELFASDCAHCHAPPGFTGPPVPLDVIGTDPTLGSSPERGTHSYRVPSLRGAGTRGPLLHDGSIPSVAALLDPARLTPEFGLRLHGSGAVPGHAFGLALPAADRDELIAYVRSL